MSNVVVRHRATSYDVLRRCTALNGVVQRRTTTCDVARGTTPHDVVRGTTLYDVYFLVRHFTTSDDNDDMMTTKRHELLDTFPNSFFDTNQQIKRCTCIAKIFDHRHRVFFTQRSSSRQSSHVAFAEDCVFIMLASAPVQAIARSIDAFQVAILGVEKFN